MRRALFKVKFLKTTLFVLLALYPLISRPQSIPLPNAFAHNDYFHKRPLYDALENGYTNIEADIFLKGDELIVAHTNPYFKDKRTLEKLYLKPLADHITANNGQVYGGYNNPIILLIDIKTDAAKTYLALKPLLEKYRSILTGYENGKVINRKITIVISGNKPYAIIKGELKRLAFIDEDLKEAAKDTVYNTIAPMASCKYTKLIKWAGVGTMPVTERQLLCSYVMAAHKYGKKVRLWASPENKTVWQELLKCGVDLINTDQLVALKNFLISRPPIYIAAN
jgi:hypothetical protein